MQGMCGQTDESYSNPDYQAATKEVDLTMLDMEEEMKRMLTMDEVEEDLVAGW